MLVLLCSVDCRRFSRMFWRIARSADGSNNCGRSVSSCGYNLIGNVSGVCPEWRGCPMIEFRSMFSADRLASLHRRAFLPWYVLFITSAGLIMYGTLATGAGVRDRSGVITAAGVCSVVTGIALLNTITRRFPLPIRVMFVAMWLAMAMAIIVLE